MRHQYAFKQEDLPQNTIVFDSTQDKEGFVHRGYGYPPIDREEYMTETEKYQVHEMHNPDPLGIFAESPPLNENLFASELGYQVCLTITDRLLGLGLLTTAELFEANGLLLAKYRPLIGELLAEAG